MSTYEARKRAWTKYNSSEKKKKAAKRWRDANKEKCHEASIKWQREHRERVRELAKARLATPEGKALRKASQNRWAKKNRKKRLAKDAVHNAVRAGKLIKLFECEKCSSGVKIEGHHPDYDKPLEVIWLCKKCHTKEHTA